MQGHGETRQTRAAPHEPWAPGTLEASSPIDMLRLTRRALIAVAIASCVFALVLWGPWR